MLLKVFDLLPPDTGGFAVAPEEALAAESPRDLPPAMRHFAGDRPVARRPGAPASPRILFPPDGAVVEWHPNDGAHGGLPLKAEGGARPLAWVVNGKPAGADAWQPDGDGFARIAVVDAEGRSAEVRVRVVSTQ